MLRFLLFGPERVAFSAGFTERSKVSFTRRWLALPQHWSERLLCPNTFSQLTALGSTVLSPFTGEVTQAQRG